MRWGSAQALSTDGHGARGSCAPQGPWSRWEVCSSCGRHSGNEVNTSRLRTCAIAMVAVAMCAKPAEAHLNATGMGPIYDGLTHFLTSPEDLIPVLALALLAGLRGAAYGRRALFTLPAMWLLGCLLGLAASATNGSVVLSSLWFLLLGGLVAADARLSLQVTGALAALLGLVHGYLNGTGMGLSGSAVVATLGLVSA